jgi:hypothetical protein
MQHADTGAWPEGAQREREEVQWERLPKPLMMKVLDELKHAQRHVGSVRAVCRRWRDVHDGGCTRLCVRDGVTDQTMRALCVRLPALTTLSLYKVNSLTENGLRAVGGLTTLNKLILYDCANVTNEVLRDLQRLPSLTCLALYHCADVTDVGLWQLRGLAKLTTLNLYGTSTTQAGRDALQAARHGLTIW